MDFPGLRTSSPPIQGRDHECAILDGLLKQVRDGRSGVLLLRGEPGIGKTALLQYLMATGSDLTLVRFTGVESEMELPYAALHDLCSPILDGLGALPEPQQRALSVALGLSMGESPDKFLVALGALGLFAAASELGPMLCVVDDAQWLDQASAQVLGFIGRRLLAEPIGLVLAARAAVNSPDHLAGLPELCVDGVDHGAARRLLGSVTVKRIDEDVLDRIVDETQGNPLALLELGARMTTAGFAGGFSAVGGSTLTGRIEDEYRNRLSALPKDTQQLVLLAAADPVGDAAVIQRAAATIGLRWEAVTAAVDGGLLTVGATVRFRHPLLRSAAYRVAGDERRAAHKALAEVTDPITDPDRRAWHRAYAAAAPDEEVAAELIGSADRARGRGGLAAAAAFWERAVALTPDVTDRSSRAVKAAEADYAAGDLDAVGRLLAEAEAGPLTELERAKVELLRAQVVFTLYRGGRAPAMLLHAATRLRELDLDLARLAYLQALVAAMYAGRLGEPEIRLAIARGAQSLPVDPAPTPASQTLVRGIATWIADGYVTGAPILKDAVRQYLDGSPDPDSIGFAFNAMALHLCDDSASHSLLNTQAELARNSGMLCWLPLELGVLAEFYLYAGDLVRADTLRIEADTIDPAIAAAHAPRIALMVDAWRGDEGAVLAQIAALTAAATSRGEGHLLGYVDYARAVLYNGLAEHASAVDAAGRAGEDGDVVPLLTSRGLYELVEAASRCGRPRLAGEAAEHLSAIAVASGTDFACGMAARSRALVAADDDADALYREAIERLSRTRMTMHVARARLSYGEWLRRQNRRIDARAQLKPAYASFTDLGANGFADRARRELQATGEKVRRRSGSDDDMLTPQEEQIAQLARERRTNTEIGAQLFLSTRTVEWHLHKIFAKLGIGSRRELDAALAQRDSTGR